MSTSIQRRQLVFDNLDEVVRDALGLLQQGYHRTGNWDLAQICGHLADWLSFPVVGFPKMPIFIRPLLWFMKVTQGRRKLQQYLAQKNFPTGAPTVPQTVHVPGEDAKVAVERLTQAIETLKNHQGPVHPSPLFGAMDKATCVQLQLVHCAHHLSFLVPK